MSVAESIAALRSELEVAAKELATLRALALECTGAARSTSTGGVTLDAGRMELRGGYWTAHLTKAEFKIMRMLLDNPGEYVSRETLGQAVLGQFLPSQTRNIDAHVNRLRHKLPAEVAEQLVGVYGCGYVWQTPGAAATVEVDAWR